MRTPQFVGCLIVVDINFAELDKGYVGAVFDVISRCSRKRFRSSRDVKRDPSSVGSFERKKGRKTRWNASEHGGKGERTKGGSTVA